MGIFVESDALYRDIGSSPSPTRSNEQSANADAHGLCSAYFALFLIIYVVRSSLKTAGSGWRPVSRSCSFLSVSLQICGGGDEHDSDRSFKLDSRSHSPRFPSTDRDRQPASGT